MLCCVGLCWVVLGCVELFHAAICCVGLGCVGCVELFHAAIIMLCYVVLC